MNPQSTALLISFSLALCGSHSPAQTQTPAATPAPVRNLISNGGFERSFVRDNLWDGVASDGSLTVERDSRQALSERSNLGYVSMPPSIAAADINGDGKTDIVAASPKGYVFAYLNSGSTPNTPVFTHGEIFPIFPSVPSVPTVHIHGAFDEVVERRFAPRIALADWRRTGALDLFAGLYSGELVYYQNFGNSRTPDYRQPVPFAKGLVQTSDAGRLWANLLAPAVADMNRDSKADLLLGEGTYSANNVHLLLNSGKSALPQFTAAERYYLAYGDGKEHLIPTVVDYNGDGFLDVITGDRTGTLSVFLNPGASWKPGEEFKFASTISIGAQQKQNALVAPSAADMNGDGLFDLVIGRTTGHIALALNTGSKTQPKFDTITDLKGVDVWGRTLKVPSSWDINLSSQFGNALFVASLVSEEEDATLAPLEGKAAVKFSYLEPQNSLIKWPATGIPGARASGHLHFGFTIPCGGSYDFSLRTRGAMVKEAKVRLEVLGEKVLASKETKLERGVKVEKKIAREYIVIEGPLNASGSWSSFSKGLTVKFSDKNLQDLKSAGLRLDINFVLTPGKGAIFFDDIKLVQKR